MFINGYLSIKHMQITNLPSDIRGFDPMTQQTLMSSNYDRHLRDLILWPIKCQSFQTMSHSRDLILGPGKPAISSYCQSFRRFDPTTRQTAISSYYVSHWGDLILWPIKLQSFNTMMTSFTLWPENVYLDTPTDTYSERWWICW